VRKKLTVLLIVVVSIVVLAGAVFATFYVRRNSVDVSAQLNDRHPAYGLLEKAVPQGEDAVVQALAEYLLERPSPDTLRPVQFRYLDAQTPPASRLQDKLPPSARDWEPGERLAWTDPVPKIELFALQKQFFLFSALKTSGPPPDPVLVETALAFMDEWRRANSRWPNFNLYAWNDDTMSNRLAGQIHVMELARSFGLSGIEREKAFLHSLLQHAEHLMSEEEHNYRTNHGIMQNVALLDLSLHYPELDRDWEWRRIAVDRMRRHLEAAVTDAGVFLELTPGYHYWATYRTLWFAAACRRAGIELDPLFEPTMRRMLTFAREILYPDRTLPQIADTHGFKVPKTPPFWDAVPQWPELVALRQALARSDCPNSPGIYFWPESGYFVLRAPALDWTPESAFMLTFKLRSLSRAHTHRDALSLTLFGRGRPLLVGPGYPSYGDRRRRRDLIGTVAQNAVSVDATSQEPGTAEVLDYDVRPGAGPGIPRFVALRGRAELYPGVVHERSLFYGPSVDGVLIVDSLSSADRHSYTQHFRPAPGLRAELFSGTAAVFGEDGAGKVLTIVSRVVQEGRVISPPGATNRDVIDFVAQGTAVVFATLVQSGPSEPSFEVSPDGQSVAWTAERGTLRVTLPPEGPGDWTWLPEETDSGRQAAGISDEFLP